MMNKSKVGFDNYSLYPKELSPIETLEWASRNESEGVSFSGYCEERREEFSSSYLRDVKNLADNLGLYVEWGCGQHVPMDLVSFVKKDIYISNRRAVGEACGLGVGIIRSCSGGLMRWNKNSPSTESILKETAKELKKQASLFRDCGIILAIETHFEFTTHELLRLFEMCEAEPDDYLGICLDTMNLLTMLEDPLSATQRVLPWIVSSHIKDGGIIKKDNKIVTFPAEIGKGVIDLEKILILLMTSGRNINLSVEDHGGNFILPVDEKWFLEGFPDLSGHEYDKLMELAKFTSDKMKSSGLTITDRNDWPGICEKRIRTDISALKSLRNKRIQQ